MKALIFIGMLVGSLAGGWIGSKFDNGWGMMSFLLAWVIGPLLGIWASYKAGKAWLD